MNPLDALSGEVDELVSSFTSTPIVGNLDTFGFTQYSFWFAVAVVLMLVLLFAFGFWAIMLYGNCLVWTIYSWPKSGSKKWNWVKTEGNL